MQRQYAQFRAQGKKIVEIPWTITSPGVTLAYQCFGVAEVRSAGTRAVHVLHSKIFRIQVGNQGELGLAWIDELKRLHPGWYFPSPGCNLLPADAAQHKALLDNTVAMYASSKPQVTPVDWQYRPGAAAETAAEDMKPAYYCERISSKPKTVYITPVRSADAAWTRDEYNLAWLLYVRDNLEKETFTGGCEAGTMKQETAMRNRRRAEYVNQGYTVRDVDWTYAPGTAPAPAPAAAPAPAPAPPPAPATATPPPAGRLPPNLRQPTQQTFYCQYLGLAKDASGKYPLYQNEAFSATALQGTVQNAWKAYIEATYRPTAPGNPLCAILPADPAQREATIKAFNLHTQPGTQTIVKVSWKP
jgi:hypothetical protein